MSQVESNKCHNKGFYGEDAVLGEAEDEAFEDLVAHRQSRLPQDRPQVVAARFAPTTGSSAFVVFPKGHLRYKNKTS